MTRTLKLTVQYDGTDFVGWQRQASGVSIQGLLEAAFEPIEGGPVSVAGAGRTDAGVHALAQIASVTLTSGIEEPALHRALNANLPPQVRVAAVELAPDGFHARFSARAKTYEYRIVNGPFISPFEHRFAWHFPQPLDVGAMRRAAPVLLGQHDFAAFQAAGAAVKSTVRTLTELEVDWDDPTLSIVVTADGFLRHMVRALVGTLVEVGSGRRPPEWVGQVLASRDRAAAGPNAPAHGLFLVSVNY